jgi:hypothetical protein
MWVGDQAMYHTIEFDVDILVDMEGSHQHWLVSVLLNRATRVQARLKPSVVETVDGPLEVVDLFFEEGVLARGMPFQFFRLVD